MDDLILTAKPKRKQACDVCRIHKKRCDGIKPVCSSCVKAAKKSKLGVTRCTYSNNPVVRSGNQEELLNRIKNVELLLGIEPNQSTPVQTRVDNISQLANKMNHASNRPGSDSHMLTNTDNRRVESFSNVLQNIVPLNPLSSNNGNGGKLFNNFQNLTHLLYLSTFVYNGYSCDYQMNCIYNQMRSSGLSTFLKNAYCFQGLFFSTHPQLFPNGNPNFSDRKLLSMNFSIADDFQKQLDSNQFVDSLNNLEVCDTIRGLLVYSYTYLAIDEFDLSMRLYNSAFNLGRNSGIFEPNTFLLNDQSSVLTVDVLMSVIQKPMKSLENNNPLTESDKFERYFLWLQFLMMDTIGSILNGHEFMIDENRFHIALPITKLNINNHNFIPDLNHRLGKFAMWENTAYEHKIQELFELKLNYLNYFFDDHFKVQGQLKIICLLRQIIRFTRLSHHKTSKLELFDSIMDFHNQVLQLFFVFPKCSIPFSSLESFAPGANVNYNDLRYLYTDDYLRFYLLCIVMLNYLHLYSVQISLDAKFPLVSGGQHLYDSRMVLYACLKSLVEIIRLSRQVNNTQGIEPDSSLISPNLSCFFVSIFAFIISSSTIIALRIEPVNEGYMMDCIELISTYIYPLIDQIGTVWPSANVFLCKLEDILDQGDPQFWIYQSK
ncbi:hypothetical protein BC833DRAFT_257498 [Globomyces pollinis-pini]|nr:hypothetical protein BC833DRAFT_257498 [Globomyces pollinis-pini]